MRKKFFKSYKELLPTIYKNLLQANKNTNNPIKKQAKNLNARIQRRNINIQ